ncbi:hypothetical protein BDV97DRAFT_421273 [Delphinella strobiligena]|nr:hypothetical protein BDV97DRAFT_421273 [Delphinella strobiligena]
MWCTSLDSKSGEDETVRCFKESDGELMFSYTMKIECHSPILEFKHEQVMDHAAPLRSLPQRHPSAIPRLRYPPLHHKTR